MCAKNCPADCITGEKKEQHVIDTSKCLKCGTCIEKCKFNAIIAKIITFRRGLSMSLVNLTINGKAVSVPAGTKILMLQNK